ncbi:substrate of the Dot/Icm secretion system (plasmid) [Legionella adelaidensis]|uniref:LegC5 n=1 Tax=Legionella adelaidensis TaxID=45056 RepID=A0A0W0R5A7_9GAMM|nr:hypothetical protein [Legionella adelaidensis]KTC66271.1 LegC5 [Legionella adelaidensis]VEH84867.1 substrate of the Dot/Icm secretion system [Legionella adelaidensis]
MKLKVGEQSYEVNSLQDVENLIWREPEQKTSIKNAIRSLSTYEMRGIINDRDDAELLYKLFPDDSYIEDCLVSGELYAKITGPFYDFPTDLVAMFPHRIDDIARNVVRDDAARKKFIFNLQCLTVKFSLMFGDIYTLLKLSTVFPPSAFFEENYLEPISIETKKNYPALVAIVKKLGDGKTIAISEWQNAITEGVRNGNEARLKLFNIQSQAIDKILDEFGDKIKGFGSHSSQAKKDAEELLTLLKNYKNEAFKEPTRESLQLFAMNSQKAIKQAIPHLQQDLGWEDYLTNLAKRLVNAITTAGACLGTLGVSRHHGFFTLKSPGAVTEAQELDKQINKNLDCGPS